MKTRKQALKKHQAKLVLKPRHTTYAENERLEKNSFDNQRLIKD